MRWILLCFMMASLCMGCGEPSAPPRDVVAQPEKTSPPPPKSPFQEPREPPYPRGGRVEIKEGADGTQLKAHDENERVKAEAGVGIKGQRLEDKRLVQMIVTPARALFRTQQRVVFEVQIPHAVDLYQATNGFKPKTHDDFMAQIIKANNIQLPTLPPGEHYVYDPDKGELMVERPAR